MNSTVHGSHTHGLLSVDKREPVLWPVRLSYVAMVDRGYGIISFLGGDGEERRWCRSFFAYSPGWNFSYTDLKQLYCGITVCLKKGRKNCHLSGQEWADGLKLSSRLPSKNRNLACRLCRSPWPPSSGDYRRASSYSVTSFEYSARGQSWRSHLCSWSCYASISGKDFIQNGRKQRFSSSNIE